ncbi:CoA ester lyase [Variovorax defluvii]|uniref:CoA ester lyase n=1 Tax=Variovorax defluvii TaxID=913761 RepID=A0ABP8HBJ3_9BURK
MKTLPTPPTAGAIALASARTFLFVPGNRPERFEKALRSGADAIVIDLEDAVPHAEKAAAREAIGARWAQLDRQAVPLVLRINPADTPLGLQDLEWLRGLGAPAAVMVPKAESPEVLSQVAVRLPGTAILPLVETAAGYAAVHALAGAPQVLRLVVGHIDFMADTGVRCTEGEPELLPLRFAVNIATRLNRLAPAVDGVTVDIGNDALLRADTQRALNLGFGAKLCIHPRQVAVVHEALSPSAEEIAWAERVLAADAASGGAAVQLDGKMVDLPVVLQARRTMARLGDRGLAAPADK